MSASRRTTSAAACSAAAAPWVDFFFQAEDGIRDGTVTGVQTCALPILCWASCSSPTEGPQEGADILAPLQDLHQGGANHHAVHVAGEARNLLWGTDAEAGTHWNVGATFDPVHVLQHL